MSFLSEFSRPSRRRFLQGTALAAGAAALPRVAQSQTPKRGGRLRYGCAHGSTTDSLDPGTYENDFMIGLSHLSNGFIAEIDSKSELVPEVAESWELQQGGKVWVLNLRGGLEFHNGKTVTAEDVIASINHHRGEKTTSAIAPQMKPVMDMKADTPTRVIVTLDAANVDFLYTLADYHAPIRPSMDGEIDPLSPVGCGPFALDEFDAGVRYKGSRHRNFHKSGRPYFDEVEMLQITDPAARTNALASGNVDLIGRVDLKTVRLLERNQSVVVHSVPGFQHYTFAMHTDKAPFDNNHVRMALKLSIKRDELVQKILKGYGSVGNDHPIGQKGAFFNASLQQREYDPEQAKWHLKQAGMDSVKVKLSVADAAFAGAVDAGVLYSESAKAANVEIEVVREPNDGYWSNVWLVKPWSAVYWGGRVVPDQMFTTAYASGAAWNDSNWEHTRFNELLVEGRAETNSAKRAEIYGEMQQIVRDEGGVLVPMFANYVFATSSNVAVHDDIAANWDIDGQRFGERWSFA